MLDEWRLTAVRTRYDRCSTSLTLGGVGDAAIYAASGMSLLAILGIGLAVIVVLVLVIFVLLSVSTSIDER